MIGFTNRKKCIDHEKEFFISIFMSGKISAESDKPVVLGMQQSVINHV